MELVPDTLALACRHPLIPILGTVLVLFVPHVVCVLFGIVLLLLCLLDQLIHIAEGQFDPLASTIGSEGRFVGLHFQQAQLILFHRLLQEGGGDLFRLDENLSRVFLLPGHLYSQSLQRFLIDGANIAEPLPIGVHPCSLGGSLMQLFGFGRLHVVHLEPLDGVLGAEGVADS